MKHQIKYALDVQTKTSVYERTVTQNDTIEFIITMLMGGEKMDLTNVTPSLAVKRLDGTVTLLDGTVDGNVITFNLGSSETAKPGRTQAVVQLYDANGRVSSLPFSFCVSADFTAAGFTPSENERTLIEVVLQDGPGVIDRATDAASLAERVAAQNETHPRGIYDTEAARDAAIPNPLHGDTATVANETTGISTTYRYVDATVDDTVEKSGWIPTERLNNPSAIRQLNQQLADKADKEEARLKAQKIEPEDWSERALALATGQGTVNLLSIPQDRSVTPEKIAFMQGKPNLFTGVYTDTILSLGTLTSGTSGLRYRKTFDPHIARTFVLPIQPNKTYTVKVEEPDRANVFRIAILNSAPAPTTTYKDTDATVVNNDTLKQYTFTNTATGLYALIYVANDGKEPLLTINEGSTISYPKFPKKYIDFRIESGDLSDGSVTLQNLSFAKKSTKNLFDGKYVSGIMDVGTNNAMRYRTTFSPYEGRIAIVPIAPNETYTAKIHEPEKSNVFRAGIIDQYPVFTSTYQDMSVNLGKKDGDKEITFTNTATGKYLMLYVANDGKEPMLQVEKGNKPTAYEPSTFIPKEFLQPYGTTSTDTPPKSDVSKFGIYFNEMLTAQFERPDIGFITTVEGGFDLQSTTTQFIYDKFDELMVTHPEYITRRLLGYAGDANRKEDLTRPIYEYYFKAKRPDASDVSVPLMLIDSGIHGYEKQAVWVTYQWFKYICENHETDIVADFMRHNIDFRVIPVVSPYSYDKNQRHNATGTDPNTNFAADWYSSGDAPGTGTYSGTEPMTEIETLLLDRWFAEFSGKAFGYINMHNTDGVNTTTEGKVGICWVISPDKDTRTLERSIISDYSRKWWKEFPALQTVSYGTMFGYVNERTAGTARNQAYKKHGIRSITLDPDRRLSIAFPGTIYNGYEGYAINMDLLGATIVGIVRNFAK